MKRRRRGKKKWSLSISLLCRESAISFLSSHRISLQLNSIQRLLFRLRNVGLDHRWLTVDWIGKAGGKGKIGCRTHWLAIGLRNEEWRVGRASVAEPFGTSLTAPDLKLAAGCQPRGWVRQRGRRGCWTPPNSLTELLEVNWNWTTRTRTPKEVTGLGKGGRRAEGCWTGPYGRRWASSGAKLAMADEFRFE